MWIVGMQCIPVVVFVNSCSNTVGQAGGSGFAVVVIGAFIAITTAAPLLIRTLQVVDEDAVRAFENSRTIPSTRLAIDTSRVEVCRQAVAIVLLTFVGTIIGEYLIHSAGGFGGHIKSSTAETYTLVLVIVTVLTVNMLHALAYRVAAQFVPRDLWGQLAE